MKRSLLLVLLALAGFSLSAQNVYVVNRAKNAVERFSPDRKGWIPVNRNDSLKLRSKVRIPKDGLLVLVESGTGLVYKAGAGSFSVKEIVDEQKKNCSSLIRSTIGQLANESMSKVKPNKRTSYGATKRGDEDGETPEEALLADSILTGAFPYLKVDSSHKDTDGAVYLTLTNASDDPLRVNIVGLNRKSASARILLPPDDDRFLFFPPGRTELPFIEVILSPDIEYKAFPVHDTLDYSLLQRLLGKKLAK